MDLVLKISNRKRTIEIYHKSLGICKREAENGVLSTAPQTREPRRFKLG